MTCPLCGARRAKRSCPALGQEICPVCCATKRLVEVRCPADCVYLVEGLAHPAAAVKRQHEADLRMLMAKTGRLSEGQMQVFFLIHSYFLRPPTDGGPRPVDAEVADAAGALAASFETASRGLIFEHPARSANGQRMATALRDVLADVGKGGGTRFEREVAEVLRAVERGAAPEANAPPRRYLDLVARVLREGAPEAPGPASAAIVLP
ncbi:MAG: hypothetical protein ABI880_01935 [Acidobacteriota bacterium]